MSANFLPDITNVTPGSPFRFWCQKVLPLVYDDSLSYYELLCKVVNYLNNTIQDVNTLAQDVSDIASAYAQLEAYVNDYFENLDVQEEINNKLDAMAEDGTLTRLIGNYVEPVLSAFREDVDESLAAQQEYNIQTRTNLTALVGSPLTAQTSAAMTDTTKIYVYTGTTGGGYTNGHWYYYNGSAWTDGGVYQSQGLNTDATLSVAGMAADAKAAGDGIFTVTSALKDNAFNVRAWENGTIIDTDGTNYASSQRIRTSGYIPKTIKRVSSTVATGSFNIYAYTAAGVFVGAWNGNYGFVNDGTSSFTTTIDMTKLYTNPDYAGYQYRLVYRISGGSVQVDTVTGIHLDTFVADFATIENDAEYAKSAVERNAFNVKFWANGSISDTTGAVVTSSERIYTTEYIPNTVKRIYSSVSGGRFGLHAYNSNGDYVGMWLLNQFVNNGTGAFYTDFTMDNFYNNPLYKDYKYKLVYRIAGGSVQINTVTGVYLDTSFDNIQINENIKVMQYNIGKFNMGSSGGLSADVETKITNYKNFFAGENVDFIFLQEFTEYIDSAQTYGADATLFDPIFLNKSVQQNETAIKGQRPLNGTAFSYLHTTGDNSSWCIFGETKIGAKTVGLASGVLNVSAPDGVSHIEQSLRALTKLTDVILANYDYAIVGMDTNCLNNAETVAIKAFMAEKGYTCGNWGYLGYKNTYNPNAGMYQAIDNVFVKGNMKIVNFTVPDVYADLSSDHYPVIAEIRI